MRHGAIAAGAALGAAIGVVLGTAHWPIDPNRVSRELSAGFGAFAAPSRATFTLLPRPTLRLWDISAQGAGVQVTAASAEATLRFDRLLRGVFVPLGVTLHDADLHLDLDAARAALSKLSERPLARLLIRGANVEVSRPSLGWSTHASVASAQIDWDGAAGPLRGAGTGRWRGQPLDISAELGRPLAPAQGQPSSVRFSLDAPLAQIRVAGELLGRGEADGALFAGQASALAPSMTRFLRWIGRTPPMGLPLSGLQVAGHVSATARGARIDAAAFNWGGQALEGALDVSRNGRGVAISGTLAADTLDLEPLLGAPPPMVDAGGGWSGEPALPSPSTNLDLDLRVSASRAVWRDYKIENPAASVSQSQGRLSVKLVEAGFAQGALSGELSVESGDGPCRTQLAASLDNADVGALLGELADAKRFSGQVSLKVALRARGRSPGEIVSSADGEATLDVADGSVSSLNFEEALRRGRRRLIDVARDMSAGATRFGVAHGRVEISDGEARFVDAATQAPGVSLALTGAIDLSGRAWRAHLAARESADDGHVTPDGARLDFALFGPWSGPVLTPLLPPAD